MPRRKITLLDGGMGRQLARMGAPFRLPEWSALALIEAPHFVLDAHSAFIASGAQIITTNSYALVPNHLGAARFTADGARLAELAGRLAREAADRASQTVLVAGSLPPMVDYRPDLFEIAQARHILDVLVSALAPHVDFWLAETQSSTMESGAAIAAARRTDIPIWISYTLRDEKDRQGPAQLRSGEPVEQAVALDLDRGVQAVLFNCSQPEVMNAAVKAAARVIDSSHNQGIQIGVYANAFAPEPLSDEPYATFTPLRDDLTPASYVSWAQTWVESGATIIGGCCGIGPEHIAALRAHFDA